MDNLPIYNMDLISLANFKLEIKNELGQILDWWIRYSVDYENGGFYGKIDNQNTVSAHADKGLVLNARILYTFSAAYLLTNETKYLLASDRAFAYLVKYFLDQKHGGFYWSLASDGSKLNGKKQVYGQAFAIYGLTEYYKATQNQEVLSLAKNTYLLLEKHSFDRINSGYFEALTEDWEPIADLRLSEKDQNEKKSMNTHLHIIEAYANLFQVLPNASIKASIIGLLQNFEAYIINSKTNHLHLFFTETWEVKSSAVSFGHDIEAAWLLQEAAEISGGEEQIEKFKNIALQLTTAAIKGLSSNGGLYYEYDPATQHWINEFHWWPQAEAMVGFFNAYQNTNEQKYLDYALNTWNFIKAYIKDQQNGEWFWGVHMDNSLMENEDKAGFWKCPYHNGRACMELLKRFKCEVDFAAK
jgi:mannobiose 2-epimerase